MSLQAQEWAWEQPIKGSKKLVLLCLADYTDENFECWPSSRRLAERCGLTRSAVRDNLRQLEAEGYIHRIERFVDGRQTSNTFKLGGVSPPAGGDGPPSGGYQPTDRGGASPVTPGNRQKEPSEDVVEESSAKAEPKKSPSETVWSHYVAVMKPRRTALGKEERSVIQAALREASVDECLRAIDGCAASPFHMGENDRGRTYKTITHIFKPKRGGRTQREQIDFFLDLAEKSERQLGFTSVDSARVPQAKLDVLAAVEMPGDKMVVERGKEAAAWLEQHVGIVWDEEQERWRNGDGR
jgi:DNA-binding Lrp family transcriptional regulator